MQNTHLQISLCTITRKQTDNQPVNESNSVSIGYKPKKQSAKILQSQNKCGENCITVLEDLKHKRIYSKDILNSEKLNSFSTKTTQNHKNSENNIINSDVDKLLSNSTNSIIEKTCAEDLNGKENKIEDFTSDSGKEDQSETKGNRVLGHTKRKYIHDTLN